MKSLGLQESRRCAEYPGRRPAHPPEARRIAVALLLAAVACGTSQAHMNAAAARPTPARSISKPLQAFVVAVETLPARFDVREEKLADALQALAGALVDLSGDEDARRRSDRCSSLRAT